MNASSTGGGPSTAELLLGKRLFSASPIHLEYLPPLRRFVSPRNEERINSRTAIRK
jgi:hypothetical protein